MQEVWVDIYEYGGLYKVSNLGRIKSCYDYVNCTHGDTTYKRHHDSNIMRQYDSTCYNVPVVNIFTKELGQRIIPVKKLVYNSFYGTNLGHGSIINLDGDVHNNSIDNLSGILSSEIFPERETWLDIPNYEGHYQVSNLGRIRTFKKFSDGEKYKILKYRYNAHVAKEDTPLVVLSNDNKRSWRLLKDLVYNTFFGTDYDARQIHNINGNEHDVRLINLTPYTLICETTGERFLSMRDASRKLGTDQSNFVKCVNGTGKYKGKVYKKIEFYKPETDYEIWLDIPGYGGAYQVSNLGRVKSVERHTLIKGIRRNSDGARNELWHRSEKVLHYINEGGNCYYVRLYKTGIGRKCISVKPLVYNTFNGMNISARKIYCINGDETDLRLSNLTIYSIQCVETGEYFVDSKDAGRSVGLSANTINTHINSGKPYNGKTFVRIDYAKAGSKYDSKE